MATANITLLSRATVTLGDTSYSLEKTTTISNISNVIRQRVTCGTSATDILAFAAAAAAGTLTDLDFMMIVNQDTTNFCTVTLKDTGADTSFHKLSPGQVMYLYNRSLEVNTTGAAFVAFSNIDEIEVTFDTASGDVEFLAAAG